MTLLDFCKDFFPGNKAFFVYEDRIEIDFRELSALEVPKDEPFGKFYGRIIPSIVLEALTGDEAPDCGPCHCCCCRGDCGEKEEERCKLVLSREQREKLEHFRLVIDPSVAGMSFHVRRPYFRMRGKPVTPEQAFDIIRRTDNFFHFDLEDCSIPGLLKHNNILDNVWYSPNFFPHPRGWVRPDGVVGINDITIKYPTEEDFGRDLLPLLLNFPCLDLVVAVTDWDEMPPYAWEALSGKSYEELQSDPRVFPTEEYPDFTEHIVYGIRLHDGAMELMAPERTRRVYAEYAARYEGEHPEFFCTDYYHDQGLQPADLDYLKRCIRSHGLEPEEVLTPYRWDSVRGLLLRALDRP